MKNLKVLFIVLCVACATAVWGEKISNYTNIVSGQKYRIGATTSNTDYYLKVDGSKISTGTSSTAVTSAVDGTIFVFEGSGASWTIKFDGTSYYLSLANSKANGKVNVVSSASTFTLSNENNKIRLSIGDYSVQKNNSGTQFGSYGNTQTDVWLEPISDLTETTVSFDPNTGSGSIDAVTGAANGTITLPDGSTFTNSGYTFIGWNTAKDGSGTFYTPATEFTIPASDITLYAVWGFTIIWSLGGAEYTAGDPTTSVKNGEKVSTLPTAPADDAISDCADTFMGWSTHNLGSEKGQGDPGDLFTTAEGSPVITQETIFYAVFATGTTN